MAFQVTKRDEVRATADINVEVDIDKRVPSSAQRFALHESLSSIVDQYDAFVFDQYGVILDGANGLEGAAECLAELSARGKKLIILSNSCAPPDFALAKFPGFGLDGNLFVGAVTSGGEAIRYIRSTYGSDANVTSTCVWLTWDGEGDMANPEPFLERCGNVDCADSVEEADFVLAHGCSVWWKSPTDKVPLVNFLHEGSLEAVDPILEQALKRNLPLICCNPDIGALSPGGKIDYMPGKMAQRYEEMGGQCIYFGKPYVKHFEACIRELNVDRERVVHVGDSLQHDIKGANDTGIDSIFVTSGIHCSELGAQFGVLPQVERLEQLFAKEGQFPTHVVPTVCFKVESLGGTFEEKADSVLLCTLWRHEYNLNGVTVL